MPMARSVGIKTVQEVDELTKVPAGVGRTPENYTGERDFSVVPPGAILRFVISLSSRPYQLGDSFDLSVNMVRGDGRLPKEKKGYTYGSNFGNHKVPEGCNEKRNQIPLMTVSFNGLTPSV